MIQRLRQTIWLTTKKTVFVVNLEKNFIEAMTKNFIIIMTKKIESKSFPCQRYLSDKKG